MDCDLTREKVGDRWRYTCRMCSTATTLASMLDPRELKRKCKSESGGLGDITAASFRLVGVTPRRYKQIKKLFGLPPICNCEARRAWLNKVTLWNKKN